MVESIAGIIVDITVMDTLDSMLESLLSKINIPQGKLLFFFFIITTILLGITIITGLSSIMPLFCSIFTCVLISYSIIQSARVSKY